MTKQLLENICIDHSESNVSEKQRELDVIVLETEILEYC